MTSLYPGTLFYTPGLNRRSTPTKAGTTTEELSKRYKRLPYNGRPWPAPSPVAGVYDISNSSTQLIMMNNKVRKHSKLRGHNDPNQESDRIPNPDRHSRSSTPVNREFHTKCMNSQSPRYTPSVCSELEWGTNSPAKFHDGSPVNPKRHTSCRVPTDPTAFQIGMLTESPRRSSSRLSLPARFQSSPLLTHPELKPGERAYLTHIARIYSAGQMMKLKQAQYNQLLFKEMEKGLYGRDEVEKYGRFINMGKDRQYQMTRPTTGFRRVMSAPPQKYHVYDSNVNNDDSFSSEKSSNAKNGANDEKEGKRPKTGAPRSTKERQLSPRSRTEQIYKSSTEIPPARSNKGSAKKPQIKARPIQNNRNESQGVKENNKKQETPVTTSAESSSDSNGQEEGTSSHREGGDRPKSRLGHASTKTAADEQKRSESESSGKENPTDSSTTYQKVPPSSPRDESSKTYENKPLSPVLENQTSSEQNDSSDSSKVRKEDSNTSSDESQHQQNLSSEESQVQQRSTDDSEGQQRSSADSEGQQRSSGDSEGQQRSSDNSEAQQRSSGDSEGQQRSSTDEEKSQLKSSQEESTAQDHSVTDDYSREDEHNTKSDYTASEEVTKSTTENTYTSQTTQDKSGTSTSQTTQDKSGTYSSAAAHESVSPRDNSDSTNVDTYTMTYDSSAANQPTDNTTSDAQNFSTEKSSSAEDKTTTNYTDDSKVEQTRRDSLELDDVDNPRRVNKDIDMIEY